MRFMLRLLQNSQNNLYDGIGIDFAGVELHQFVNCTIRSDYLPSSSAAQRTKEGVGHAPRQPSTIFENGDCLLEKQHVQVELTILGGTKQLPVCNGLFLVALQKFSNPYERRPSHDSVNRFDLGSQKVRTTDVFAKIRHVELRIRDASIAGT